MKVRSDERRDNIIKVATQVFLESGFERASMDEISERTGGSKATLYGYFHSKGALFLAVIHGLGEKYMAPALARLEKSTNEEPRVALQRFGEELIAFGQTPEAIATLRVVMSEAAHSDIARSFYETGPKRSMDGKHPTGYRS